MKWFADFFVNKMGWIVLGAILGVTFATLAPRCDCKPRTGAAVDAGAHG